MVGLPPAGMDLQEAIPVFCEVTGADEDEALRYLQLADGDLSGAVAMHFAASDGMEPAEVQAGLQTQGQIGVSTASYVPPSLVPAGAEPVQSAFACIQKLQAADADSAGAAVAGEAQETSGGSASSSAGGGLLSSVGRILNEGFRALTGIASEDFDDYFESEYGKPKPPLSNLGYAETLQAALKERRLVVLWLHDSGSDLSDEMCIRVLQDHRILDVLWRSYIVLGADICRFEPSQLAHMLQIQKFPALVLLQPKRSGFDDFFLIEWPLGVFAKPLGRVMPTEEGCNVDEALAAISGCAAEADARHREVQEAREASRIAAEQDRLLREQQDAAYEESLLRDQQLQAEAERKKADEDSEPVSMGCGDGAGESPRILPDEAVSPKQVVSERKKQRLKAAQAIAEMGVVNGNKEPRGDSTSRILVKLPTGKRIERCFGGDSQLSEVYAWVDCAGELAGIVEGAAFEVPEAFELATTFPRKVLDDHAAKLCDLGLVPSAALMLKELEETPKASM